MIWYVFLAILFGSLFVLPIEFCESKGFKDAWGCCVQKCLSMFAKNLPDFGLF